MYEGAQRRPEHQLRRHPEYPVGRQVLRVGRSTKAGASTPATPIALAHDRGLLPRSTKAGASTPATPIRQRRPASTPATHGRPEFHRSTKAGASTPATRPGRARRVWRSSTLNEGRSINSGDTQLTENRHHRLDRRSTKAGASTPATRCVFSQYPREGERSTKAGASTPATRSLHAQNLHTVRPSLNEGRSINSGDTREVSMPESVVFHDRRSTKAGASTPATRHPGTECVKPLLPRSTKAGASTPATRILGPSGRNLLPRSTKAGASTPATP